MGQAPTPQADGPAPPAALGEAERLRLEVARLQGQAEVLHAHIADLDAADEHRRAEIDAAWAEAADARVAQKEAQTRLEEWRRQLDDARERLSEAERQRAQAEQERAAVVAALGRRARKHLPEPDPGP